MRLTNSPIMWKKASFFVREIAWKSEKLKIPRAVLHSNLWPLWFRRIQNVFFAESCGHWVVKHCRMYCNIKLAGWESTLHPLKIPASFLEALEWKLKRLTLSFMPGQRQYSLSYTHFKLDKIKGPLCPSYYFSFFALCHYHAGFLFFFFTSCSSIMKLETLLSLPVWFASLLLLPFCLPQSLIDLICHFSLLIICC